MFAVVVVVAVVAAVAAAVVVAVAVAVAAEVAVAVVVAVGVDELLAVAVAVAVAVAEKLIEVGALMSKKASKAPPFAVGDRVRTTWPLLPRFSKEWWSTTIVAIKPNSSSSTGWSARGAGSPPCPTCGAVKNAETPWLATDWFEKVTD